MRDISNGCPEDLLFRHKGPHPLHLKSQKDMRVSALERKRDAGPALGVDPTQSPSARAAMKTGLRSVDDFRSLKYALFDL